MGCCWTVLWLTCLVTMFMTHASGLRFDPEVKPACPRDEKICRVTWTLTQMETMVLYNFTSQSPKGQPIVYQDGKFHKQTACTLSEPKFKPVTKEELEQVNLADGRQKYIYAVNGQIPGPTLVVYEGQQVEVTVVNKLDIEGTGIHWHGMYQKGTPWMDGVTSVTQCTINIGETFVYRFKAEPYGTHWYHSHTSVQRSDGLYGGFIVLPRQQEYNLPEFDKDYVLVFHDWHHLPSNEEFHSEFYDFNPSNCETFESATLINGKGLLNEDQNDLNLNTISTFPVKKGNHYRLRFINTGYDSAYEVQIQKHQMTVIASDGSPLQQFDTDVLYVHIGERYDVYIKADQTVANYWINFTDQGSPAGHHGYAILQYEGADSLQFPSSEPSECTVQNSCQTANCPDRRDNCKNIGEMNSTGKYSYFTVPFQDPNIEVEDHFLVFGFTAYEFGGIKASINRRHFVVPSKPPQVYREVDFDRDCENSPPERPCTHLIRVTRGQIIQMVLASSAGAHPIHMHGHDFDVVKVVYGKSGLHPDIVYGENDAHPTWKNASWLSGHVPGINTRNPPEKDVVIIPSRGYVVVRFVAKNPGWWMLHCHIEKHQAEGMALIMQEGEATDMTAPPPGFPQCGSFKYEAELDAEDGPPLSGADTEDTSPPPGAAPIGGYVGFTTLGVVIGGIAGVAAPSIIRKIRKRNNPGAVEMEYRPARKDS